MQWGRARIGPPLVFCLMIMKKLDTKLCGLLLAVFTLTACGGGGDSDVPAPIPTPIPTPTPTPTPTPGDDDEVQTLGGSDLKHVTVHDPSVVWDPTSQMYYIFGSHRANAKSSNLLAWNTVTVPFATATIGDAAPNVAFTTPAVTKVKKGGAEVNFPAFDAQAWAKRGNPAYDIKGNLWAPDVIYNKKLGKVHVYECQWR